MQMKGLVAIVTGSSRGIGQAIAKQFGREGASVAVVARLHSPTRLSGTASETVDEIRNAGGEAFAIPCDVTDEQQVRAMVQQVLDRYEQIDVLVNNAGVFFSRKPSWELESERWDQVMAVNVRGPYLTCKEALPVMMQQRHGSILNIGSVAGTLARPGSADYCTSKAALHMFSLCLAEEVREYNIAVNVLDPGGVKTDWAKIAVLPPPWEERVEVEAVTPSAVFLALQTADTFTGRVVRREEFGKTWP